MKKFNAHEILMNGGECRCDDGRPAKIIHILDHPSAMWPVVAIIGDCTAVQVAMNGIGPTKQLLPLNNMFNRQVDVSFNYGDKKLHLKYSDAPGTRTLEFDIDDPQPITWELPHDGHAPFDLDAIMANGGKCQTKDGVPVTIVSTKGEYRDQPVTCIVHRLDGRDAVRHYPLDGCSVSMPSSATLIPRPITQSEQFWMNVYDRQIYVHPTHEAAQRGRGNATIATVPITIRYSE